MNKIWKYFTRGAAVASILFSELPQALQDKKLTMAEMAHLMQGICAAMDWPVEIAVPDSVAEVAAIINMPK